MCSSTLNSKQYTDFRTRSVSVLTKTQFKYLNVQTRSKQIVALIEFPHFVIRKTLWAYSKT